MNKKYHISEIQLKKS